ncbi:MAG: ABC transporter permease [Eubacterium sp.]|nr:ABC transporter permease [Eubacterium sp.]
MGKYQYEICFTALTAVFFLISLVQLLIACRELPKIIEWYDKGGYTFSDRQLQKLSESTQTGFYVQAQRMVEDEVLHRTQEMTVRWADAEYFEWSGMRLEAGDWPKGTFEAAVSDEWALEHYKYLQVAGRTVKVGGWNCRISGVYRTDGSWRQQLAGDGVPAVYLSFQPVYLPIEYEMHYLYFAKEGKDFQQNQQYLEDVVAIAAGTRVVPDISLDMENVRHICLQNIVIGVILWLLLSAWVFGKKGWQAVRPVLITACAAAAVFYRWYIPMTYLTGTHVFDFAGYIRRYIWGQNLRHLYQESGYFGNLAHIHIGLSWGMLCLELLVAVKLSVSIILDSWHYVRRNKS